MPPTIGLEAGEPAAAKMREILLRHPEVITAVSQHGRPDDGSDASPFSNVELFVPLKPYDEWPAGFTKDMLIAQLQKEFNDELPGVDFNFSQYIQDNVEEALSGVKGANSVKIIGRDLTTIERLATEVMQQMQQVKGIADLGIFHVLGQPNLNIKVNREKAARYGLNTGDVNTVIQAALGGTQATTLLEGDRQFNVVVRLPAEYRSSLEAARNVKVGYQTPSGVNAYVPLSELADITLDTGASYIYHESGERYIPVKFSVRDRDLGRRGRRSAAAYRRTREAAAGLSHRVGRRVRRSAEGAKAAGGDRPDQPASDRRAALRLVQFAARQPDGAHGHSVCRRRRRLRALFLRTEFQHLGSRRVHLAVRCVGDERHPDHDLLQ